MYAGATGFSGPAILDFFSRYDVNIESYPWQGGAPSRHVMLEDCLARFDLEQQRRIIADLLDYDGPMKHGRPSTDYVEVVREWLSEGRSPIAGPIASGAETLNWASVNRDWKRALDRIGTDPAAAITAARSLLESVCIHILRERALAVPSDGDLPRLYREASRAVRVSPDQQSEPILRQVLGGCATVANGLAAARNTLSDAHGRGPGDPEPAIRHARLAVNAAGTVALFLIETHLASGE
jgi:hypothetical protein